MAKLFDDSKIEEIEKNEKKSKVSTLDRIIGPQKKITRTGGGSHAASKKNRDYSTSFRINKSTYDAFNQINIKRRVTTADILNDFIEEYINKHSDLL